MSNAIGQTQALTPSRLRLDRSAWALAALLAFTTVVRFTVGSAQPLWLDETWTGMIAGQKTFEGFVRQVYDDANAPLYYLVAWLWAEPSGLSNAALRLPAALFGTLAPLVALGATSIERPTRILWCNLMACWVPALWFSQDARCYTLLFLLGVANAVAFAGLLARPTHRAATAWAVLSALMILTHYYAAVLVGVQGILYLATHRAGALRTWPAALAFVPAAGWIGFHFPRLAVYSRPDVAWYPLLSFGDLPASLAYLPGSTALLIGLCGWAALALALGRAPSERPATEDRTLWLVAGASLAAAAILIALGFLRPSFVDRYLTPCAPGALLGLALVAMRLKGRWAPAPLVLVALFTASAALWAAQAARNGPRVYNFEHASTALMATRPERLVFFWDHPATPVENPEQLAAVGGFFFQRSGRPVAVDPVKVRPGADPNPTLLEHARAPRTVILWLYDTSVQGTAARRHPPRIERLDPSWRCRDFGQGGIGIIGCWPAGATT